MNQFSLALAASLLSIPFGTPDLNLEGTWIDEIVRDSIGGDGPQGSTLRVPDIGIDGYRFVLEKTPLTEIAEALGAAIHRSDYGGVPHSWLCLTTEAQVLYIYSSVDGKVNAVGLDNSGPAPISAGCVYRAMPVALDMPILPPGTPPAEVQTRYGMAMGRDTGTFGDGTFTAISPGSERMVWQGIAYRATAGTIDAYAVSQITGE